MNKVINQKVWIGFLVLLFIFSSISVFAKETPIQAFLTQPAVYEAKKGDTLSYTLEMSLPEGYERKYKTFSVTVKFDTHLKVKNFKFVTPSVSQDAIKMTKSTIGQNDIFSFTVNNVKRLKGERNLAANIQVEVKKDMKNREGFKNSFVLTTFDLAGNEVSNQKDISSTQPVKSGILKVDKVLENTTMITGQTEPNGNVSITSLGKEIGQGKSDDKGNFSILINPQKKGTVLVISSSFNIQGIPGKLSETITVGEEDTPIHPVKPSEESDILPGTEDELLEDIIDFGKDIKVSGASRENAARFMAALTNGQYMQVKTGATISEKKTAISEISAAILELEPKYISGYPNKTFEPGKEMTRGEVAVVFHRLLHGSTGIQPTFKDVDLGKWYSDAIGYMEQSRLITGYEDKTFKPNNHITRAEFAAIIAKILRLNTGFIEDTSFSDVKTKHWAYNIIGAVEQKGLMKGDGKGKFNPDKKITRAEACVVINRAFERANGDFYKKHTQSPFKDVNQKHWAYSEIMNGAGALY